jgi:hypothetical protein
MEVLRKLFSKGEKGRNAKEVRDFPTVMVVGIETVGEIDLALISSLVKSEDKELVVFGNRSPAFRNPNTIIEYAPKFSADLELVLLFEKYPNKEDPFAIDPFIIVRRSFLLRELDRGLEIDSLGKLVIRLAMSASEHNLKVIPI